jgi:hypothetical protein
MAGGIITDASSAVVHGVSEAKTHRGPELCFREPGEPESEREEGAHPFPVNGSGRPGDHEPAERAAA